MASLLAATCLHAEEVATAQPDMALLLFLAEAEMIDTKLVTPVDLEDDETNAQKVDSDAVEETP